MDEVADRHTNQKKYVFTTMEDGEGWDPIKLA